MTHMCITIRYLVESTSIYYCMWRVHYLAKKHVYHAMTKNINVRFHFVWEILDEGDIELQKIHTKENLIDMLIKVIPGVICILQGVTPYLSSCLNSVELIWMNYRWLDPLSKGT